MGSERGLWTKNARLDDWIWSLLFAVLAAPALTFLGFVVTFVYRWNWLGFLVLGVGGYVQQKLAEFGLMTPPMIGGHMPDFGFQFVFDMASIFVLTLLVWHGSSRLKNLFSKLKSGKA
jgi:hypothetical protein